MFLLSKQPNITKGLKGLKIYYVNNRKNNLSLFGLGFYIKPATDGNEPEWQVGIALA